MAINTPTFRKSTGSVAMTGTYNTIVYDYFPMVSVPNRPIYWDSRYSMEWASGKVSYEHNTLLSSGIGLTAVEILNKRILGGELIFKNGKNTETSKKTTDFIKQITEELDLNDVTETANLKRLAGGSSYYILSPDGDGLSVEAIGIDQAYITFKGRKPINAKLFINFFDENTTSGGSYRFFLIEERFYKKGKPYTINKIYKSNLPQIQGSMSSFNYGWRDDTKTTSSVVNSYKELPQWLLDELETSGIVLDVEVPLPFKTLGVFHIKNTTSDLRHPNSKYGRPLLSAAYDLLWAYDFGFSILAKDMQVGRALTFVPTMLNGNTIMSQKMGDSELGNAYYQLKTEFPALFDDEFVKLPQTTMDYQAPSTVQFDIRSEKIKTAMDDIASKLANQIGISPTYFLSILNQANETKTATEIASDMSETNLTVTNKRRLLQKPLNELINEICYFYDKNPEDVFVTFPPLEEMNRSITADYIVKLRSVNGMSDEMLVDYAYKELSEAEKQEEVNRIKELRTEKDKSKQQVIEQKGEVIDETKSSKPDNNNRE